METRRRSPLEIPPKVWLPISWSATWLRLSSAMTASTWRRHKVQEGWSLPGGHSNSWPEGAMGQEAHFPCMHTYYNKIQFGSNHNLIHVADEKK